MKYGSCGYSYILETEKLKSSFFKLLWVELNSLLNPGLGY